LAHDSSPVTAVNAWKSPVLFIHGDDDRNVYFTQTVDLVARLREKGVEIEQLVFADDVHDFLLHRNWLSAYHAASDFFDRPVKTESKVVAPMAPNATQIDAHGLLLVEVLDVQPAGAKAMIHARGQFLTLDAGAWLNKPGDNKSGWDRQHVDPQGKSIEFTISPDGSVNEVKGLDFLFPEQQQAWQQWVARFALAWTLPANGMKFGEKWKLEQAE